MAYQIDFTESIWAGRRRRKLILRLLLLAAIAGAVWGVHDVYKTYNEPTLNMRLAEYESASRPIEEMNVAWDTAAKEYGQLVKYYRLIWAANPTNFLSVMASADAPRLRRGFRPVSWTLTTGGDCRLDYRYAFDAGDKAEQAKGLEDEIIRAVTSVVRVVNGKVDVQGVRHENLLDVDGFSVAVRFQLPDVRSFPAKEAILAQCVDEIAAMRKKVQESKFADKSDDKGVAPTAQSIMMAYLPSQFGKDKESGKVKADFPDLTKVLDVSGWFKSADLFIAKNKIPGDEAERKRLKEKWNAVGDARFPWDRFRVLDNEELVVRTKTLGTVADGVKRFKGFLEKRKADNTKKLEPFVEAYDREKIGNEPVVESDLKDRVAAAAGIPGAVVTVDHKISAEHAALVKDDERFVFTWVPWTLSVGQGAEKDKAREANEDKVSSEDPLTLEKLADCVRRALTLGPGYALDKVTVSFGADGNVSGAALAGLFPAKTIVPSKEAKK